MNMAGRFGSVLIAMAVVVSIAVSPALAQEESESKVLFTNVNVWDGTSEGLQNGMSVLIEGKMIAQIAPSIRAPSGATVIDGGGRTLMPGLIDNHTHLMLNGAGLLDIEANQTWEDLALRGGAMAKLYLMEGFTTVRDMGGANGGLTRAINAGTIIGPRVYPSGAFLGGRGGHADFATYSSRPAGDTQMERLNMSASVDGADAVLRAARNNFRQGASQLKIMQTGGVASLFDPWQLNGMTADEIAAAVEIANAYQSYVGAHSYTADAMIRALDAGVKTIEHGFMFNDEVHAKMVEKGAYITTNLTAFSPLLAQVSALSDPRNQYKLQTAQAAFTDYLDNVRRLNPKRGHQTDCVGGPVACQKQMAYEKFLNAEFFGNHRALVSMTSVGGEIAALSGPVVNPYPLAKLGVIEGGAYADILLVDGNPLRDITVIGAVDKWFDAPERDGVETIRIIMKDGVIYKNTLNSGAATN